VTTLLLTRALTGSVRPAVTRSAFIALHMLYFLNVEFVCKIYDIYMTYTYNRLRKLRTGPPLTYISLRYGVGNCAGLRLQLCVGGAPLR
jgi:hypothetical protein